MDNSKYRTLSRILRVGKELLVLLEITILTNKDEEDASWFTDSAFMDLLLLLREPIHGRMDELMKEETETKRKMTHTRGANSGRSEPHCFLVGEKVKVGLQFKRHSVSKTCLTPNQGERPGNRVGSAGHSGGGFEKMILFPEKVQVVVCNNSPSRDEKTASRGTSSTDAESRPTSRYFKAANPGDGMRRAPLTGTAKKKRLTLKKIVSKKNSSTSRGGGFPVTSDSSNSQTLRTNKGKECASISQDKTCQKPRHSEEEEEGNIENETNKVEEVEVFQIEDNLNTETGTIPDSGMSDHRRKDVRDVEIIREEHESNCSQSKRMSHVSSEDSDDEDAHDVDEGEEDADVSETYGVNKPEFTTEDKSEVCHNRLHSDDEPMVSLADPKDRGIRNQDVLSDDSCSDPRDDYYPDTDVACEHGDHADGGSSHNDERDDRPSHPDRNIAPCSQRDHTDQQRSTIDQAGNFSASKRHSQNVYQDIEPSEDDQPQTDGKFEDILSENEGFDQDENHDRKSGESAIPTKNDGRYRDGSKRVKKRLYADIVGDDPKTVSTFSRQSTPMSTPLSCSEDRNVGTCKAADKTAQAENEMLTKLTDSDINDYQRSNKKKKRKLNRRRREMVCFSSSDEDSCQVDISCLLEKKDINKNVLNPENKEKLARGTEKSHSLESYLASRKSRRMKSKMSKTASGMQDTDRDSFIDSIASERMGKTAQRLANEDSNQRTSPIDRDQVMNRSNLIHSSIVGPRSEDDSLLQKEPFVDTGETVKDDDVDLRQLNDKNVVSNGRWVDKGHGRKLQRTVADRSRRNEFAGDERGLNLSCDHADGISHQSDSDESLPDVSYAREVEKKTTGATMATNPFTEIAKELSNQSCSLGRSKDLHNDSSDGREHPLGKDNDFLEVADQSRLKITSDTKDSIEGAGGKSVSGSNCLSPAKSSDQPSSRKTFFRASDYEDLESDDETFAPKRQVVGISKNKKRVKPIPRKAVNSQNNKSFGSLKRYDDTVGRKRSTKCAGGRRESQIEVTPENFENWWTTKSKKNKKAEVVDLVAMDDKMIESLKNVKKITELSEDQLQYLTKDNEGYLREIFQGKRACVRHTQYKKSSAFRAEMTYLVSYGDFTQEHLETIMDTLVPIFCKRGSKFLDYVSKVLLPELLVKISMDVLHLNYQEAESLF